MAVEEQMAERLTQLSVTAGRLSIRVSEQLARLLIRKAGWMFVHATANLTGAVLDRTINSGKVSEKRLQRISGGDIHEVKLDPESLHAVSQSLRQAGITYAVEQSDNGYYLHFRGRDIDHVEHSVARAFEQIGLTFEPQEFTPQKISVDDAATRARQQAQDLVPRSVSADAPDFTMVFNTVKWDSNAEIIANNLQKMGVPFEQQTGPEAGQQSFTFAQPYAPAVQRFIDTYSEKVAGFNQGRVANYEELAAANGDTIPQKTMPQEMPDQEQTPQQATSQQQPEQGKPTPQVDRSMEPQRRQSDGPQRVHSKEDVPTHAAPNDRPADGKPRRAQAQSKGRKEFLARLNHKASQKLNESRQAPVKTISKQHSR